MRWLEVSILLQQLVQAACAVGSPPSPRNRLPAPHSPPGFRHPSRPGHGHPKVCTVPSSSVDAAPAILKAAHKCNNGGVVYFPPGETFVISSPLDLTFLRNIDFAILGTITFNDSPDWWVGKTFNYAFQSASLFWRFGGTNVRIHGAGRGTIDGRGQSYWNRIPANSAVLRPILLGFDGLKQSSITDLNYINPPGWFHFLANSTDVLFSDLTMVVNQLNASAPAKNTDGWDTYRSSNIVIQNSYINNTDDCVAFKPNSSSIVVQNLHCQGCHGISVGSLGQYVGEVDIVEDIYVYNSTMTKCGDIGKVKVWPGAAPGGGTSSGGGSGHVKNITWEAMVSDGSDEVIQVTQCYGVSNSSVCAQYPSAMVISDIVFKDFTGAVSKKYDPRAGTLVCSSETVCYDIAASNINVTEPSGKSPTFTCTNIDKSLLEITCT